MFSIHLRDDKNAQWLGIVPHPDGGLWVMANSQMGRFQAGRFTPQLAYPRDMSLIRGGLCVRASGDLLFSLFADQVSQIARGDSDTIKRFALNPPNRLPTPTIVFCLFEDREANIWVGTIGGGLLRLRERRVTMLNAKSGLPDLGTYAILEDHQGAVWVGTNAGLARLSAGLLQFYYQPESPKGRMDITALCQTADGALWFAKRGLLVRHQAGRFTEYPCPQFDAISALLEDRQGRFWLGTRQGLARFQQGQITLHHVRDSLTDQPAQALYEDRAGNLWVGTTNGVSRLAPEGVTNYTRREGFSNECVRDIYEDQEGVYWFCTYGGGLNRLQNGRLTTLTTKQGLPDDFLSRLLVDEQDNFWLLSNHGVLRISRRSLNEVAAGQQARVYGTMYNEAEGMQPSEGNGGHQPAGWRTRDGRLWFATIRGVAIIDPRATPSMAPTVQIERVLLEGTEYDPRQPLEILPGQSNLEIHYTGVNLSQPEQVQFSYQLGEQAESWTEVGTRRTAYFSQLPPGTYHFRVKAASPAGVWSAQAASLNFVVRPPFWRTAWFRSLAALFVIGLALLGYRQRVAQLRRRVAQQESFARQLIASQESERKRIAAELHDGLGQSLVIIKRRAQLCLDAPDDHERALEQAQEIVEASTHALDEVKEIIFDLRPQQLDRLGLTGAIADLLAKAAATHKLELVKELDDIDGLFAKEDENSFYRIVQESLNNVVRHAAATRVAATLRRQPDAVKWVIRDNGRGFVVGAQHDAGGSFGLRGIRERARLLGGQARIESTPGEGTTVWLSLPLKEQQRAA